ncbi:HotDog domain-containing protein [Poronia punctata]|nr:HotDog domain-containing protein [Poronia punctata]
MSSSIESIPWCAALLQKPGIVTFTPHSRMGPDTDGNYISGDQLFRTSLNTETTVPGYIGLYQSPFSSGTTTTLLPSSGSFLIDTVHLLFNLQPGLNGFNGTTHGGLIAALMDEAMGSLLFMNSRVQEDMRRRGMEVPGTVVDLSETQIMTANMNIKFMRPIKTPQVVMATATLNKIEGRKFFLGYDVRNGEGKEFAIGEGMWISLRKANL